MKRLCRTTVPGKPQNQQREEETIDTVSQAQGFNFISIKED
jgi:hypothetical protein